jgi:hypothetical protein
VSEPRSCAAAQHVCVQAPACLLLAVLPVCAVWLALLRRVLVAQVSAHSSVLQGSASSAHAQSASHVHVPSHYQSASLWRMKLAGPLHA